MSCGVMGTLESPSHSLNRSLESEAETFQLLEGPCEASHRRCCARALLIVSDSVLLGFGSTMQTTIKIIVAAFISMAGIAYLQGVDATDARRGSVTDTTNASLTVSELRSTTKP